MILAKRLPSHAHNSYPMSSELAPCSSSPELLASPPATPPRSNKHSFSKPMTWLNRSTSSTSTHSLPRAAPKPTRISEPRIGSSLEQLNFRRGGPLGSGATVVRTPQEALSGSIHGLDVTSEQDVLKRDVLLHDTERNEGRLPPRSFSPPLPPLPDIPDAEEGKLSESSSHARVSLSDKVQPAHSSGSPPPSPCVPSSRPTLLGHSRAPSRSIPTFPTDANLTPPQPPFEAILLSPIPNGTVDPSKLIVTLETCTTTYRTSLGSIVSRPSRLSRYITSLLSPVSETASVYSNVSDASSVQRSNDFSSFFRDHLASSAHLPRSTGIHVFLDRPSAPYVHLLAYLRSLPGTPELPESLPRAVQLASTPHSRLESLLELRDEANYLGLVQLEKLCCHEIHCFQCSLSPSPTGVMSHSQTGSVHSFHTVVEKSQSRQEPSGRPFELRVSKGNNVGRRVAKPGTRESSSRPSLEGNKDILVQERGKQGRNIKCEVGSPPPGWI